MGLERERIPSHLNPRIFSNFYLGVRHMAFKQSNGLKKTHVNHIKSNNAMCLISNKNWRELEHLNGRRSFPNCETENAAVDWKFQIAHCWVFSWNKNSLLWYLASGEKEHSALIPLLEVMLERRPDLHIIMKQNVMQYILSQRT